MEVNQNTKKNVILKLNTQVFISTLTSLRDNDMIKIDVTPGDYKLIPFSKGYVFTRDDNFEQSNIVKIFGFRNGDKGLTGTYHGGGDSKDPNHLRIFKTWLSKRFDFLGTKYRDSFVGYTYNELYEDDSDEDDSILDEDVNKLDKVEDNSDNDGNNLEKDGEKTENLDNFKERNNRMSMRDKKSYEYEPRKKIKLNSSEETEYSSYDSDTEKRPTKDSEVKEFNIFHNLPYMFYLNKQVTNYDLIQLEELDPVENCCFLWNVYEGEEHIGYLIEKDLIDMLGDLAGIGIYERAQAFGNFSPDDVDPEDHFEDLCYKTYNCFLDKNCNCDTNHKTGAAALR